MSQINQFLQDINKHSSTVKKCTQPLQRLGVTCFYYIFTEGNGNLSLLTDCPQVEEYYHQEKVYLNDPHVKHPDHYEPGLFFFKTTQNRKYGQSLAKIASSCKVSPFVGLCEKQKDSVEFFGFWGHVNTSHHFERIYLNYGHLLKAFATYFKQECSQIIQTDVTPTLSLKELIGTDLFKSKPKSQAEVDSQSLRQYLIELGFSQEIAKADLLSTREKECIKLLVKGKSTKEIATLLGLSPRTVEHYLENIKNKFNCLYKNELFFISEQLIEFGLI